MDTLKTHWSNSMKSLINSGYVIYHVDGEETDKYRIISKDGKKTYVLKLDTGNWGQPKNWSKPKALAQYERKNWSVLRINLNKWLHEVSMVRYSEVADFYIKVNDTFKKFGVKYLQNFNSSNSDRIIYDLTFDGEEIPHRMVVNTYQYESTGNWEINSYIS